MSPDVAPAEIVAVTFILESSLAVQSEWPNILKDYVLHMLKRLHDNYTGYRIRVAFVTYGTADTLPSPLLCKRFFIDYQLVVKEMGEHPLDLGIGQTNSGGSRGMAALEGLVAAIELFDLLRNHSQVKEPSKPNICHAFHIAASPPDTSKHPVWNVSPGLDFVTWDALPLEFKKRNIHFSAIYLRSQIPTLCELCAAAAAGGLTAPWFPVHAPHSISLAGFGVPVPQSQPKVSKRPGDIQSQNVERTPEAKRPRLSQPVTDGPKSSLPITNMPSNSSLPLSAPTITQTQSLPVTTSQAQPSARLLPANLPPHHMQIIERLRTTEEQIRKAQASIKHAEMIGDKELMDKCTREYNKLKEADVQFKKAISEFSNKQAQGKAQAQQLASQNQMQSSSGPSTIIRTQSSPVQTHKEAVPPSFVTNNPSNDPAQLGASSMLSMSNPATQSLHSRSLSNSGIPQNINVTGSNPPVASQSGSVLSGPPRISMPGNVAAQMQKLLEQRHRNMPGNMPALQSNQNASHLETGSNTGMSAAPGSIPLQTGPFQTSEQPSGTKPPAPPVWRGALTWTGTSATGKKEIVAYIVASSNAPNCRTDTWPETLVLVPTREPAVEMPELQEWLKRHQPALCTFQADTRRGDAKANEGYYKMLVQILSNKKIYATATWTLPSGAQVPSVLVFPINNFGLVGAFFPLTGIPEMPKSASAGASIPPSVPSTGHGISASIAAHLQRLNPEQRAQFMNHLVQQQRRQLLARQGESVSNTASGNNNPMMMPQNQQQIQQLQQSQDASGGNAQFGIGAQNQANYGNMNGLMGHVGGTHSAPNGSNPMDFNAGRLPAMSAGLPRPLNGGTMSGIQGNVSYEMLQSFMQRNAEGGPTGMGTN